MDVKKGTWGRKKRGVGTEKKGTWGQKKKVKRKSVNTKEE